MDWTEEEDKKIFLLFKLQGSNWTKISQEFSGKTGNNIKNRFYSILRRMYRKKNPDQLINGMSNITKKDCLLKFVDEAINNGHACKNKRGRKKKSEITQGKVVVKKISVLSDVPSSFIPYQISQGESFLSLMNPISEKQRLIVEEIKKSEIKDFKLQSELYLKFIDILHKQNEILSILSKAPKNPV
jgi:hypothetical protein